MDDCPFAILSHPYCHRVHDTPAIGFPIAGHDVEVLAAQAVRAMVAVFGTGATGRDLPSAVLALEGVALIAPGL